MFLRNIASTFLGAVLCVTLSLCLNRWTPLHSTGWVPGIILLTTVSFAFNFYYAFRSQKAEKSADFTGSLIGGVAIRFLIGLVFLLIMWLISGTHFLNLAAHFILHYVLFTVLEIRYLSGVIKAGKFKHHRPV